MGWPPIVRNGLGRQGNAEAYVKAEHRDKTEAYGPENGFVESEMSEKERNRFTYTFPIKQPIKHKYIHKKKWFFLLLKGARKTIIKKKCP